MAVVLVNRLAWQEQEPLEKCYARRGKRKKKTHVGVRIESRTGGEREEKHTGTVRD